MSVIYYGVAGEGRGHASRARCIVDHFKHQHEFVLLTSGDATPMLRDAYRDCVNVRVREVRAMRWQQDSRGRVAPLRTLLWGKRNEHLFMADARNLAPELKQKADLVVSDFEVVTAHAARKAGIKLVTIDHQRFLAACDFRSASLSLRIRANLMGKVVTNKFPGGDTMFISGFYLLPFKKRYAAAHSVGVLLRDEIRNASPVVKPHLVVYLRKSCAPGVIDVLRQAPQTVHLYGAGKQPSDGSIQYHEVNSEGFAQHLSSATALVTTAGNQLLGEALYLKKPVLAFPEPGNAEQKLNGHLLNQSGMGVALDDKSLTLPQLLDFLRRRDAFVSRMDPRKISGNEAVLKEFSKLLSELNE